MTWTQHFDYDDYLREFRAACAKHGVDPVCGATGYQVVHITTEQQRQARKPDRWWERHDLWVDCPPYRSEVEEDAFWQLFAEMYLRAVLRVIRARRRWRMTRSLRELHECQVRKGK